MKILFLLSRCDQTGMTTHTLDLGYALVEQGHSVTTLMGGGEARTSNLYERFLSSGMKIVAFPSIDRTNVGAKIWSMAFIMFYLMTHRFDVIHVQSPYLSFIPWLLHKPFVSTLHVNDLVRCFYYKNATHLIAISRETKDYAQRVFGYSEKEITIVNHGVSMRFAQQLSKEEKLKTKQHLNIPTDKVIIGLVGSIEPRKGHDILLKSVSLLPASLRNKVHIVFIGSNKSKSEQVTHWLNDCIDECGLRRQVSIYEYQDALVFYQLMDIFILPSRLEGFGLVVIEAMLNGVCCVRSNSEGAYEQIEDGKDGFIFEKENVEHLSRILQTLLEKPDIMHLVANAGREKALQKFTSEVMAKNTVAVYRLLQQA